ncbi:296_t:CDS:2, partial [Acaulospora morrowiae]
MTRQSRRGPYSKACTNCHKAKKGCSGCINTQCQRCIKRGLRCIPYKNNCKTVEDERGRETYPKLSSSTTTDFQSSYEDQQIEPSEIQITQIQEIMHGNSENKHITNLIRCDDQPEKPLYSPANDANYNALYVLHE